MGIGAGPGCDDCLFWPERRSWWGRLIGRQATYKERKDAICGLLGTRTEDERFLLNRVGQCGPLGNKFKRKQP